MKAMCTITIFVGFLALLCQNAEACWPVPDQAGHVTIPDGDAEIKPYQLATCEPKLKSITIPNSVKSIGSGAFDGSALTEVNIPNGVTTIKKNAFIGCSNLTSVTLPDSLLTIEQGAFVGTALTKLVIPNSVTSLGEGFCQNLANLESVTIGNSVSAIAVNAFRGCTRLASVTLPASLKTIGEYAFFQCKSIKSLTIPYGVTSIGKSAFHVAGLTRVNIPGTVTEIGEDAFVTFSAGVDIQCDKQCETGEPACNPECNINGCTVARLKEVSCPGTGNCPDTAQCKELSNSANVPTLSLAVTSVLVFACAAFA